MSDTLERVRFRGQPLAHPQSIVVAERARFTVLTPCLLRLEWSETGQWEDRSSYAFPDRYNPQPPKFNAALQEDELAINSGPLLLRYRHPGERFSADNLSIEFKVAGSRQVWRPGLANPGNLRGTRRTLDWCAGDAALDAGLLSRDGWALVDDSRAIRFSTEEGWPQPAPDHELQDWYFFGYGHDYEQALADYTRFGGPIPLIPRFVLGAWWSRYWAYSAQDLKNLVRGFERHGLPLDVLVIDMDWHTP
ncbi:MAG: alpha-glucosidase, partial [Chloroflexia bacterium]|nr:alpha-glucosidase [Chloroflexia bacterium]